MIYTFPDTRILVFSKAPEPGQVLTRLCPPLGEREAAELYTRMVHHTLVRLGSEAICPVQLWCTPSIDHPFFQACQAKYGVTLYTQGGLDLGERIGNALEQTLKAVSQAIIVATDAPELGVDDVRSAIAALSEGYEVVVNPSEDGGFVLLGANRSIAELSLGLPWGTNRVWQEMRNLLDRHQYHWHALAIRWDVDRPEDLERLAGVPDFPGSL